MSKIKLLTIAICCSSLWPLLAGAATPTSGPALSDGHGVVGGGRSAAVTKAAVVDTQLIMGPWGSGALYNGQFENPDGVAAWNGWTSQDLTDFTETHWHVDPYHAVTGYYSAWCGDASFVSCGQNDPDAGGYGNNWNESLEWRTTVADPALPCTVDISALVNYDCEPSYDYCFLSVVQNGLTNDLWIRDGIGTAEALNFQTTYLPIEYEGPGNNEVVVQFRFESDPGWSDEDCSYPTAGAIQVDDVQIDLSNGTGYSHDFEDGTLGEFQTVLPPAVGNFARVWTGLRAPSGMASGNTTPMVAFIDDGIVVPGTGGSHCINWCYGPGGYIVNSTGGLLDPDSHLHNAIYSPVMAWPGAGYEGAELSLDVWRDAVFGGESPFVTYTWATRSTDNPDPAAIESLPWRITGFFYFGSQAWLRQAFPLSGRVGSDTQWLQIRITVQESGFTHGLNGNDGTPAPYFDNVSVKAFPPYGPAMSASAINLPHDNFPDNGVVDLVNLGQNSVRFDMGGKAIAVENPSVAHGDSVVITVKTVRSGASLVGAPRLYWHLQRNPLFDPYRTAGLPDEGSVAGWPATRNGSIVADRFAFDLPDSGFLFPGDILHYYFEATDVASGVQHNVTMPADTTGFSNFADPMAYRPDFRLQALPTLSADPNSPGHFIQPEILFWDDGGDVGNRDEWYQAFRDIGLVAGVDYDVFFTKDATVLFGQGIGGFATTEHLTGYDELIYSSGVLQYSTLSGPDDANNVPGFDDIGLLTSWLQLGGKDMLLTGDNLAGDLAGSDAPKVDFLENWMGVDLVEKNALATLGTATGPLVEAPAGSPVFLYRKQWSAVPAGELPSNLHGDAELQEFVTPRQFNGVAARTGAQQMAEFLDPAGLPGQYAFSAATLHERVEYNARIISLPYDFQSVWELGNSGNKTGGLLSTRAHVLADILSFFGRVREITDVPEALTFGASHYPNPFNPMVTISYTMPRAGHLSVKVFDVRGRLVAAVVDGQRAAGPGEVRWDGRTTAGEAAAAGVYFYEARTGEDVVIGKMALIK